MREYVFPERQFLDWNFDQSSLSDWDPICLQFLTFDYN